MTSGPVQIALIVPIYQEIIILYSANGFALKPPSNIPLTQIHLVQALLTPAHLIQKSTAQILLKQISLEQIILISVVTK